MNASVHVLWMSCLISFVVGGCLAATPGDTPRPRGREEVRQAKETRVVTYPAPRGASFSQDYAVSVNGKPVDVYIAPVWDPASHYPGAPIPPFGGPYSFAYFDFEGRVEVKVTTRKPLARVKILPESRGITPNVTRDAVSFILVEPCRISVEPDVKNGPLLLFANPIEVNPPKPGDPGVRYYGPGMHEVGVISIGDNETLYVAGGAILKGAVRAQGSNVRLTGRGIIDGGQWEWTKGPTPYLVEMVNCTDAGIDGVILKDSWYWTFVLTGCRNVRIDNLKICSARCENNDGIDIVNSQHVRITNAFIRSDDDCIAPKGMDAGGGMAVEDVAVTNCVLWTDRAHVWRIGFESHAEAMRDMLFKDIDVIHCVGYSPKPISLQPVENMPMENIRFEDIRVNAERQECFLEVKTGPWELFENAPPGRIRNCSFKDIIVTGGARGPLGLVKVVGSDPEHIVENVVFENIVRYGERVTKDSPEVRVNEFTRNITFK